MRQRNSRCTRNLEKFVPPEVRQALEERVKQRKE